MLVVFDTNIAISGLLWGGAPNLLVRAVRAGALKLATSEFLLAELSTVLKRRKLARQLATLAQSPLDVVRGYAAMARIVEPADIPPMILHDPPDDRVLGTAIAAEAHFIVSGDHDLLDLGSYRGIEILSARQAIERLL